MNSQTNPNQDIILHNREQLKISGVEDVSSFDETGIILESSLGSLSIDGEGLHITRLSVETGEIEVEGKIGGVVFFEADKATKKRGLFARKDR